MKSNYTSPDLKSLQNQSLSFFQNKINTIGGWSLIVFLLFSLTAFTSTKSKHDTAFSYFSLLENEDMNMVLGDNDTIDLALAISTPNTFTCPGDQISFTIQIANQGALTVQSFEITDYVPTGLTLSASNNAGWVQTGNKVKKMITSPLTPNSSATQFIYFDMDANFTGASLENRAEISFADADNNPNNNPPFDLDSSLDDIDTDSIGGDNIIDNSNGDEDDHDYAIVNNDMPVLTDVQVTSSVCNFDNGTITLTPNTFTSYDWSDGGTGAIRIGLFAGLYSVTVTKANGCTSVTTDIEVNNDCTGCMAIAGTVTMDADTFCIPADTVTVTFTDDGNSFEPQPQFLTTYFLTKGDSKAIMAIDTAKQFKVWEKGIYRIHVKVFDLLHIPPEEIDSIVVGVTPITFLDQFLQQGGGYLCGALDTVGTLFEVGSAVSTVVSTSDENCGAANGSASLEPVDFTYSWSDGGAGNQRNDLTAGTYTVTVDGCAGCQGTQTVVIGNDCVLNDTIHFTLGVDSMQTFCGNGVPAYFSNNTTTTLCNGGVTGGDGIYGTYIVSETGCLDYTSNSLPGNNIDTICVVVNDDMGNADTTVFIPSLICHTVPQIINVPCNMATSTGLLCLDIPLDSIATYNVVVDALPVQNGFVGCNEDSTVVYDYSQLFAQGNLGPYDLDSWSIGGQTYSSTFQNMQELVDSMNVWDAATWTLSVANLTISGGDPTQMYGSLMTTHPLTSTVAGFPPTIVHFFMGTSTELTEGVHQVIYTKIGDNCPTAALQVTVSCTPCVPFLQMDTVQVMAGSCNAMGDFCVGIPTANIFEYQITVDGAAYGGTLMSCDFSGTNDGTDIQLSVGLHELIFTEIATACVDTVLVNVNCPPCPEWLPTAVTLETTECNTDVFVCINVPTATLSDYQITNNGALFNGSTGSCMNGTDASIAVDTGFHEIIMLNLVTGCADTMGVMVNCIPDTIIIDTLMEITGIDTLCFDEAMVGDIANVNILCGDTVDVTINYTFDTLTNCIIFEGVEIGMDTLCFRLFDAMGNRTDVFLNITVTPPCGDGFVTEDSINVGLSDCAGTTNLCVDIPLSDFGKYNVTDNGMAYGGTFQGCDFDTTLSYNYFTLPVQGTAGPYNVDAWMVNGVTHTGVFMNVAALVDSMNVWDATGTWVLNMGTQMIEGGNTSSSYGNMTVTQMNTSAFALLELNTNLNPNGTAILIGQGAHEIIFIDTMTLCQDTVQALAVCLIPEIVLDTINVGDMGSYCVDTTELLGNVIGIANACPDQSGNMVSFAIVGSTYCVDYDGLAVGENTACIIVCDDMGLCDTTTIIVTVLSTTLPTAVNDSDVTVINQPIVINILGNDTINGVFDSLYILSPPSNGAVSINLDGTASYTPSLDYCDDAIPDSYTYILCNTSGCDTATVTILVLCDDTPPVAVDDSGTTLIDEPIVINIMGNDTINGVFDTLYLLTPPLNGTVVINTDGTAEYTPNSGYCDPNEPDSYTYVLCNVAGCDTATVTITIACENIATGELAFFNGFTPNGDDVNDYFVIQGVENYQNNVLCVFNRWGNQIYRMEGYTNDPATAFNGHWENVTLPEGTYFYVFDDGEGNRYSGYVQIAR